MKWRLIRMAVLLAACVSLNSCWLAVAGAGATAGYMARDSGYRVQSPVTQE